MRATLPAPLLVAVLSLAACRANVPTGVFDCDDESDCPPEQICIAGTCHDDDADAGSPVDAPTTDDAHIDAQSIDAFIGDDGGADAPMLVPDAFVDPDAFIDPDAFTPIDAFAAADAFAPPDAFASPDAVSIDAFVPPDAACTSARPCGLVPQCGCGAGQGCFPSSPSLNECAIAAGRAEGAACSNSFQCSAGHVCASRAAGAGATCQRMCRRLVHDDCVGDALCANSIGLPDVDLCTTRCDLGAQTGCGSGLSCVLLRAVIPPLDPYFTDCTAGVGTGMTGTACVDYADCAQGFACASGSGLPAACRRYCDASSGAPCEATEDCLPIAVVDGRPWGACVPR